MLSLKLVKERKIYEMSWEEFEEWYPKDDEIEGVLKKELKLGKRWNMDLLEPFRPFEKSSDRKKQKGYVRFSFTRNLGT